MFRAVYAIDLTDTEWQLARSYVRTSGLGRPPLHSERELLSAIFCQLRSGSAWHLLPPELLPCQQFTSNSKPDVKMACEISCSWVCS
jgi:transposase